VRDLILTSSLDIVYDVCDGRSIAIRKGLSTRELGMFEKGRNGEGRVLFRDFGKEGLAVAGSNILRKI
jgi:hypothetical protein